MFRYLFISQSQSMTVHLPVIMANTESVQSGICLLWIGLKRTNINNNNKCWTHFTRVRLKKTVKTYKQRYIITAHDQM